MKKGEEEKRMEKSSVSPVTVSVKSKPWGLECAACGWMNLKGLKWEDDPNGGAPTPVNRAEVIVFPGGSVRVCLACAQRAAANGYVVVYCRNCGIVVMLHPAQLSGLDMIGSSRGAAVVEKCFSCLKEEAEVETGEVL